jgi:predicted glycosyltransferase
VIPLSSIWIDLINPSHALFFRSLIPELNGHQISVTLRDRAETVDLTRQFGIKGKVIGTDYRNPLKKSLNMIYRTLELYAGAGKFDYAMAFENGMSTFVSNVKRKESILFCDNDLKFIQKTSRIQDLEMKLKLLADHIIIPKACYPLFSQNFRRSEVIPFDGYKEDIYIADYKPDPNFREKIPFDNYVVLRPEALGSFYVTEKQSIVPYLLHLFWRENINVIYLPREKEDLKYAQGFDEVFIPERPLNGLDLCYYSDAVLTGSGTMAREAACMGKKAVSFFPSVVMLSVDKQLMHEGKIFHSRSPTDIVDYVLTGRGNNSRLDLAESKAVKQALVRDVRGILAEG